MNMLRALSRVLLVLTLAACAVPSSPPVRGAKGHPESNTHQQLRARLERGDFLGTLLQLRKEVPANEAGSYASLYNQALVAGAREGERLLACEKYCDGGKLFRKLLTLYPRQLSPPPSVSTRKLKQHLAECSDRLMAKGLAEYRAGQLEQAIASWRDILSFDSKHRAAKKAIDTTTIQLRNLRSKK